MGIQSGSVEVYGVIADRARTDGWSRCDLDAARDLAERIDYLMAASDDVSSLLDRAAGTSVQSSNQPVPRQSAPTTSLG